MMMMMMMMMMMENPDLDDEEDPLSIDSHPRENKARSNP